VIGLVAVCLILDLFYGGKFRIGAVNFFGIQVYKITIVLLLLVLLKIPLMHQSFAWKSFARHQAAALFLITLMIYLSNGRNLATGDSIPARYLPLSILREGNFYLDEFTSLYRHQTPYYLTKIGTHYVSAYPVGAPLLALPFYLPTSLGRTQANTAFAADLENLAAATIVAFSAAVLFSGLCYLMSASKALLITLIYAFGTSSFSVSSQALWQHGPSQLAILTALYCLLRGRKEPRWIAPAGLALAFAVVCRPTNLLVTISLTVYVLVQHRKHVLGFVLSAVPWVLFQFWYNITYFHDPFHIQFDLLSAGLWRTPILQGLAGLLLSPARGLLVYSPVFILSCLGAVRGWWKKMDPLFPYVSISVVLTLLLYSKWSMWWGGGTFGPRFLADITPLLAFLIFPVMSFQKPSAVFKILFVFLTIWSVGAHSIEVFAHTKGWNARMNIDRNPERLWLWNDNQLINTPKKLLKRMEIILHRYPTNVSDPELLSATYSLDSARFVVSSTKRLPVRVSIRNSGKAAWLAWPKKDSVSLFWLWMKKGKPLQDLSGRNFLQSDLLPEETRDFPISCFTPDKPGNFILEIGLITNDGWIPNTGQAPIRLRVRIDPSGNLEADMLPTASSYVKPPAK